MLRAIGWASAGSAAASATLLTILFTLRPIPAALAWPMAYAVVILAMLALGGLAWIVLSLPAGAPARRRGLEIALAALGITLGITVVLGGLGAPAGGLGAAMAATGVLLVREP